MIWSLRTAYLRLRVPQEKHHVSVRESFDTAPELILYVEVHSLRHMKADEPNAIEFYNLPSTRMFFVSSTLTKI